MKLKKFIQFSIGPIIGSGLSLVTLPFISWFFSVEDVGRLTMLQVVLGLSVSLFSLSMHESYVREYHEEEDKSTLFKVAVVPGLFLIVMGSFFVFIFSEYISNLLFGIRSFFLTALLLVGIFSNFFINFLVHVIRMQERGLAFSAAQIAPKVFLLMFIGLILILNIDTEFKWIMLMNTLAVLVSFIILAVITRDTWLPALFGRINKALLKRMLDFSLPLVAGGMAFWGLTTMDRFFLRKLAGFEELGVYAISVSLAGSVSVISTIFSNLWHPIFYKWVNKGVNPDHVQRVIENMLIVVALIWSVVGLLSWILPFFFPLEYQAVEYLIVPCVAMPLFYMLSETTAVGIGITRRTTFAMLASICAFIANLVLNYLLIPDLGAAGAALATLISFFVFFLVRTEASAWLWFSLPRKKIYIVVVLYMVATSVITLRKTSMDCFSFSYIILLVLTLSLYSTRFFELLDFLRTILFKRL